MRNKILFSVFLLLSGLLFSAFTIGEPKHKEKNNSKKASTTLKKIDTLATSIKISSIQVLDTVKKIQEFNKLKLHKKNAHASYYHTKFNGRKTASGEVFSNDKYTAAHKKLPFGTMLKVTNEKNGNFVVVKVNDRGPFTKSRDIDLSRKSFMELVDNKDRGTVSVTIEIIEE